MAVLIEANPHTIPFSLTESRHDLSTFKGRFLHYSELINPATLLASVEDIEEAQAHLERFKEYGDKGHNTDADMWRYKKLVDCTVHPSLGTIIPAPVRLSAFAPVFIPLTWAMLAIPHTNTMLTLSTHFLNQSYNAACNYHHRSGASMTNADIAKAYTLAVGSACSFAFGLGKLFKYAPPSMRALAPVIPFLATAAANVSNIGLTRSSEIIHGVAVTDKDGNVKGKSKIAGLTSVYQSAVSRCLLVPAAVLFIPPVFMAGLKKAKMLPKNPRTALLVNLATIYASVQVALPAALSVYPQTVSLNPKALEPEFHGLSDHRGSITTLYANKGL